MKEYRPLEYYDFTQKRVANKQRKAIEAVRAELGKDRPNFINGKKVKTKNKLTSVNPSNVDEIIAVFSKCDTTHVEKAMKAAWKAFDTWKTVPAKERAKYLFDAAKIIKKRRMEINAWMVLEAGKNYLEADADTCEAIDFLEFYGREAIRYAQKQELTPHAGEENTYEYIPLGVGVVIPPWNFPFAILVGMTAAAIAAGNTVLLKPSSETPMMGWLFADILQQIELPAGVVNYMVGSGSVIGDHMVKHPKTRFISFTGSMEVGLGINALAAQHQEGQIWMKRVVAEMGGKDAIIVDSEADVDAAAQGVAAAAFGFQGQKCSACSRAIVDKAVYDEFIEKLIPHVEKLVVGPAEENHSMGPVVSESARKKILEYMKIGAKEGKLLTGGGKAEGNGFYLQPTVIKDVKPKARIAQEEIFGPVLAVIKAKDYDDALKIANGTQYGLTGAVYSNNEEKLDRAHREFHVGNLYLNRKCTGALVGVHPFGGFNMSGTDSKAGSRDYLALFLQGKSIAKKI